MKLASVFTGVLTAATAVNAAETWEEWECARSFGGGGHDGLRRIHRQFNRLFGNASLKIASDQCYVADCDGLIFAVCHNASYTRQEIAGARNLAVNMDPGDGTSCFTLPTFGEHYLRYLYGRSGDISFGSEDDVRRC